MRAAHAGSSPSLTLGSLLKKGSDPLRSFTDFPRKGSDPFFSRLLRKRGDRKSSPILPPGCEFAHVAGA